MILRKASLIPLTLAVISLVYLVRNLPPISISLPHNPLSFLFSKEPKYLYGQEGPLYNADMFSPGVAKPPGQNYSRLLVMGRLYSEDIGWLDKEIPDIPRKIYVVDSLNSGLPANKGHEAMVYLTYIIDHYDSLPDVVMFFHPHQGTWHNNILLALNSAIAIKLLSPAHVVRQGYFNARCHLDPGCPNWLHVDRPWLLHDLKHKPEEPYLTSQVFHELHGADVPIPRAISQPCCAQFAVSGERIRQRPRADYVRYRDWLLKTDLSDHTSGRLMEYSWQYIFTGNFEFCPSQHRCYCDGYGMCFEGEEGLKRWLALLREKEIIDQELTDMYESGRTNGNTYRRLAEESHEKDKVLNDLRETALRRGYDPKTRAEECGREWHEGDGF